MAGAKVQPLRPAPAGSQSGGPPRSPERAKLAEAIERKRAAGEAAERVRDAKARAHVLLNAAYDAVDVCEAALRKARDAEPKRLVQHMLSGGAGGMTGSEVPDAEAALAKALADLETMKNAGALLDEEAKVAAFELEKATHAVGGVLSETLSADPAVAALVEEFERTKRRLEEMWDAMSAVSRVFGLPREKAQLWQVLPALGYCNTNSFTEWRDAIERLRAAADAPLPAILLPSGDRPAPDAA